MKTFDEAFELVATRNPAVLRPEFCAAQDYMSNPVWRRFVIEIANHWWGSVLKESNAIAVLALTCAVLRGVFQAGVLTGIEMEKREEVV